MQASVVSVRQNAPCQKRYHKDQLSQKEVTNAQKTFCNDAQFPPMGTFITRQAAFQNLQTTGCR